MGDNKTAEKLLNNIMETLGESVHQHKASSPIEEEISSRVTSQFNSLFGRQKPVHTLLGGGKSADVMLWRNKKISSGFLVGATAIWAMFEWLNYHFLSLVCFALVIGMILQFVLSNASGFLNRSSSDIPRIHFPNEWFVDIALSIGTEVNRSLKILQDVACYGNLRQFLLAVSGLLAAAMIGSWCNFLTVLYIGFVAAHTLPVLYEKYDVQVDGFVDNLLGKVQHHYKKIDARVLSKVATRKYWGGKRD